MVLNPIQMTKTTIQTKARGTYRWERDRWWPKDRDDPSAPTFENGDAVVIDPFSCLRVEDTPYLREVYATFIEYANDDIAKVYIPPERDEEDSDKWLTWFKGGEGVYLIHEGYLTPQ